MSPARISEASEAFRLLEPHNLGLLDCVRAHVAILNQRKNSVSFGEAFARWADLKKSKSKKYTSEIRQVRAKFDAIQGTPVCDIKAEHLEPILASLPPASRNAHLRRLRSMFNYAMKRGWMPFGSSPIARMDFAETENGEVETFSPEQVEAMLNYALKNDVELLPFLTLAVFCGIRPEGELSKLLWSDLKIDGGEAQVVIRPDVSKTHRRRFVDVSANAMEWLSKAGIKESGKIVPFSEITLRRKRRAMCDSLGIEWIQQGMRHSFCSYWLAKHEDVDKLVLQSGHTDAQTMWDSYHRGVTRAEAEKFWSIVPPKTDAKIIAFASA